MAGNPQPQQEQDVNFIEENFERINIKNPDAEGNDIQSNSQLTNCTRCGSRPSKPDKYCGKCSTNVADGKITKKTSHAKPGGKYNRDKLPPQVLSQIMTFLNESELKACTEVNREFRRKAEKELTARCSKDEPTL